MNKDDRSPETGPPMNNVDQQVFYQILENTARTAEEVTHLRGDLRSLSEANGRIEDRVAQNEGKIQKHDLALRMVQFLVGALALGFGGYIWTII